MLDLLVISFQTESMYKFSKPRLAEELDWNVKVLGKLIQVGEVNGAWILGYLVQRLPQLILPILHQIAIQKYCGMPMYPLAGLIDEVTM